MREHMTMKLQTNEMIRRMREAGLTLALAESITCGLAAHKLSSCVGVSDVLKGSIVCYMPEAKSEVLGISQEMMKKYSCESKQVTEAMARYLSKVITADLYASVTGLASSGGSETKEKPVGTVFYCVVHNNKVFHERKVYRGTPLKIKEQAAKGIYEFILSKLDDLLK